MKPNVDTTICRAPTEKTAPITLEDESLAALAAALGHPARVAIVRFLKAHGACVCGEIVGVLPLAQSTVSQHLKVLKTAGWVRGEVDGPRTCYCLEPEALERFRGFIDAF